MMNTNTEEMITLQKKETESPTFLFRDSHFVLAQFRQRNRAQTGRARLPKNFYFSNEREFLQSRITRD